MFKVAKYAYEKFHFGDLVFGVYQLALHHSTVNAMDSVNGVKVDDPQLISFLIQVRLLHLLQPEPLTRSHWT